MTKRGYAANVTPHGAALVGLPAAERLEKKGWIDTGAPRADR